MSRRKTIRTGQGDFAKRRRKNASVELHRMIISTNPTNLVSYRLIPLYELWRPRSSPVSNDPIDFPELFCLWVCCYDGSSRQFLLAFVSMVDTTLQHLCQ